MSHVQRLVPAGVIATIGAWVCYTSFTQEPADAFLFPRLISAAFVLLALLMLVQTILGRAEPDEGLNRRLIVNLLPGFAAMSVYVFWAAETLGFYTATAIAFFVVLSLYDPGSHLSLRIWVRRILITAGYIAVIYGLFALLLKVYTPREIFF